jgi:hypothetical protein
MKSNKIQKTLFVVGLSLGVGLSSISYASTDSNLTSNQGNALNPMHNASLHGGQCATLEARCELGQASACASYIIYC